MAAQEQQQQAQANRGILPSETLNALDYLVDRLNASSGRLPSTSTSAAPKGDNGDASASASSSSNETPMPIRALLVGTNEGVGLSRSLGSAHTRSQMQSAPNDPNFSHSGSMSEEVLSSIETVWATLVSAAPPHVMAASAAGAASATANDNNNGNNNKNEEKKEEDSSAPVHVQPPHPLLSPLQLGDQIRTATATYDNCTLMHVHMAPLVVTFVMLPDANVGAVRSMALPLLKVLLEPVRRALVRSRGGGAAAPGGSEGNNSVGIGQEQMGGQQHHQGSMEQQAQQQAAAQQQAMQFMQQQQQQQPQHQQHNNMMTQQQQAAQMQQQQNMFGGQMDPALQQQLYQQQLYQQQQMMMAQQQQQGQGQFQQ